MGPPLGSSVSGMQAVLSLGFRVRSRGGEGSILEGSILEGSVLEGSILEGSILEGSVLEVGEPIFERWTSRL